MIWIGEVVERRPRTPFNKQKLHDHLELVLRSARAAMRELNKQPTPKRRKRRKGKGKLGGHTGRRA